MRRLKQLWKRKIPGSGIKAKDSEPGTSITPDPGAIRVMHVCYLKPGSPSGYEVRVVEEVKVLVQVGIKVFIAVFIHPDIYADNIERERFKTQLEKTTGATIYIFPTVHFFNLDSNARVKEEIDEPLRTLALEEKIQILHGQALYAAIHASRVSERMGRKAVFDIHGILPEETRMRNGDPERVKNLEKAEQNIISKVDLRIMVSGSMHAYYKEKYKLPEQPWQLIPCCVHIDEYEINWEERVRLRKEKRIDDR